MKKCILSFLLLVTISGFSQDKSHYKKVYDYNQCHQDWALVKTIANTYGFINREGKEVVPAIYSKIYDFEVKKKQQEFAMVKNVAGAYGFIDKNGKEIVQAIYFKKEEAVQKLNTLLNGL